MPGVADAGIGVPLEADTDCSVPLRGPTGTKFPEASSISVIVRGTVGAVEAAALLMLERARGNLSNKETF